MTVTSSLIPGMAGASPQILPPIGHPTFLRIVFSIFNENGTWFWILVGLIVVFVILRYVPIQRLIET